MREITWWAESHGLKMPTNKHAQIRYHALDRCFSNFGRRFFWEDLLEACNEALTAFTGESIGIKKRQLMDDIRFMESEQGWSIPLDRHPDGRRVYYRYEDPNYSIRNAPLNPNEEAQLRQALLVLERFKGLPQFEWMDELTTRLESSLGLTRGSRQVIAFEENPYLKGAEHLSVLVSAILERQVLEVEYQSFRRSSPSTVVLHPYFLKQYNNRWFLFGWNEARQVITNLALDRIGAIQHSQITFREDDTDWNEFFEEVIGVSIDLNASPERILIKAYPDAWPYIRSKPLHGSQRVVEELPEHATFTIDVQVNRELLSTLLSFGPRILVIAPLTLHTTMKTLLRKASNLYDDRLQESAQSRK